MKPAQAGALTTPLPESCRAVKVSAKGKHVKCKVDLERCLFWDSAGNRVPRPAEFARRRGRALVEARYVWLMARQWGVLFEVRRRGAAGLIRHERRALRQRDRAPEQFSRSSPPSAAGSQARCGWPPERACGAWSAVLPASRPASCAATKASVARPSRAFAILVSTSSGSPKEGGQRAGVRLAEKGGVRAAVVTASRRAAAIFESTWKCPR